MSRPLRIEYPDCWYHVMNRGRRHEDIFISTEDYQLFLKVVQEAAEQFGIKISAYCLMPNHYHMLVQTPHGNLSRCMRHINGVYTQRFNRSHEYDGQLFRGRYKAVVVENDQYLLQVMRYIHQNPLRAGITDDLACYPWSSHHGYLLSVKRWNWLNKKILLDLLSKNRKKQLTAYKEFILQNLPEEIEEFYSGKKLLPLLGSESFIERLKVLFGKDGDREEFSHWKCLSVSAESIIEAVADYYLIEGGNLIKPKRGKDSFPRDLAMYLIKLYRMDTLKTISGYFSNIHYSTVSNGIARAKCMVASDAKCCSEMKSIKRKVENRQEKT